MTPSRLVLTGVSWHLPSKTCPVPVSSTCTCCMGCNESGLYTKPSFNCTCAWRYDMGAYASQQPCCVPLKCQGPRVLPDLAAVQGTDSAKLQSVRTIGLCSDTDCPRQHAANAGACLHACCVRHLKPKPQIQTLSPECTGTLYLGDRRDGDSRYPSERLSREQTLQEQPGISGRLADDGAVLYRQEGTACCPSGSATQASLLPNTLHGVHTFDIGCMPCSASMGQA